MDEIDLLGIGAPNDLHCDMTFAAGEDGRAVLATVCAAYDSAGSGRKIELPFESMCAKPIDLWKG